MKKIRLPRKLKKWARKQPVLDWGNGLRDLSIEEKIKEKEQLKRCLLSFGKFISKSI